MTVGDWLHARVARRVRREANRARDRRDWATAARNYRRYLLYAPEDSAILVQLGHMSAEAGEYDAAEDAYVAAARLTPDDADLFLCWGHLRKRRDDAEGARKLYATSFALNGNAHAADEMARIPPPAEAPRPDPQPDPPPVVADRPPSAPQEAPAYVGRVHRAEATTIHAVVMAPDGPGSAWLDYRVGERQVGRSFLNAAYREGEGYAAKAVLDLERAEMVSVRRMPDGTELDNSPILAAPPRREDEPPPAWSVPLVVAKLFDAPPESEMALVVATAAEGVLSPHLPGCLRVLREQGVAVHLTVLTDRPIVLSGTVLDLAAGTAVRVPDGGTLAAWAHALKLHPEAYGASVLYLLDDGMAAGECGQRLASALARVRASGADLVALTDRPVPRWHLHQSLLALKPRLLSSARFQRVMHDLRIADEAARPEQLSRIVEEIERTGHGIGVLLASGDGELPALDHPGTSVEPAVPLVRSDPFAGPRPRIEAVPARPRASAGAGTPATPEPDVVAQEEARDQAASSSGPIEPRNIAFYGPWNYAGAEGDRARAIIAALRRLDVRLNLFPIPAPFHHHRPLGPQVDVVDFSDPADVAIVQLEANDWHLLSAAQRTVLGRAGRRIACWSGRTTQPDDDWWHHFPAVDRIWTTDRESAELLARDADAPVDIVPIDAPNVAPDPIGRRGAPRVRSILHLLAANSGAAADLAAAITRAFDRSGLSAAGWRLLLKTIGFNTGTDELRPLRQLVDGVERVFLAEDSTMRLTRDLEEADIVIVSATDPDRRYPLLEQLTARTRVIEIGTDGSSRQLAAADPGSARIRGVRASVTAVAGAVRTPVDEPALAGMLQAAATSREAGPHEPGAELPEILDAVAQRMAASLRATAAGRSGPGFVHRIKVRLLAGIPPSSAQLGETIHFLIVDRDGDPGPQRSGVQRHLPTQRDHWIVIVPDGSVITPLLGRRLLDHARNRPDVQLFYADDVAAATERPIDQLRLKPAFDLTLLAAQDYIGAPVMVRADALDALGGLRAEMKTAAIADLLFRAHERGMSIERIPDVLLAHPQQRVRAAAGHYRSMLAAQPLLSGYEITPGRVPGSFALARRFTAVTMPDVTIVVPTCRATLRGARRACIETLLESIAATDWTMSKLTVLVGDDHVDRPEWEEATWPFLLRRLPTPRAAGERFNYAAKMNTLWRAARTEQIVFMNDDVAALESRWLKAIQTFALDPGVGGVGARLLFEDGSLQHAGLAPHGAGAGHVWVHRWRPGGTYQDWAQVHREWSMVTGAVFATRRSLMEQVNGFDERFALEFNDSDLCLRLRALGLRIVCTPHAEMVHAEKVSRGETLPRGDEVALFASRWRGWLERDPAWHPALRLDAIDATPLRDDNAWYL